MSQRLAFFESGLSCIFSITEDGDVRLVHFSAEPHAAGDFDDSERWQAFRLVELQVTGENHEEPHDLKHIGTQPGKRLKYQRHSETPTEKGRTLELVLADGSTGLLVTYYMQFFTGIPVVRCWTTVTNRGSEAVGLEYLSSFALTGLADGGIQNWQEKMRLRVPHNTWYGEGQWREYSLPELGLARVHDFSLKRLLFASQGSWSTSQYLPLGYLENSESGNSLFWQIEHNGAWHWELSDLNRDHLYLRLGGPTEQEHHWWKNLQPGQSFTSVPVAVGATYGGFDVAMGALTRYRRRIRRVNRDNEQLPIIFNDYMNCLWGDPTTEKLLPLIDVAAEMGCDYFCIDAGWYADGNWWDTVGGWLPSQQRFPGGLQEVLDRIKVKGMLPGLWVELEVFGMHHPQARELPDNWFFCLHGKRVLDRGRYQLDFRNPAVQAYADEVIDRLVGDYGVGYIKMDYNINAGWGTELASDSPGDGLLEHNRAYLAWLDRVFARYPDLVIENCSSGGMRMDYALLSRQSIQSSSDQTDYRRYPAIATGCAAAVTPEQCAVWVYPLANDEDEAVIFNLVNALLMRIHLSGQTASLGVRQKALVQEGLEIYRTIRRDIPQGLPIWPLGLPTVESQWISLGLRCANTTYLAVWRLASTSETCLLPLAHLKGLQVEAACIYPAASNGCKWQWQEQQAALSVSLPSLYSARLFTLKTVAHS